MNRLRTDDRRRVGRRRMWPTLMALEDPRLLTGFTVLSTLDDGGDGTLRWAVGQANAHAGADTIVFDEQVFQEPRTITLGGTQLELSDATGATTITGPKAGVTIGGGGLSRIFQVDAMVTASLSGLTITGGNSGGSSGGGLANFGTINLNNTTVSGNSAYYYGGGVYNRGTATLTDCTISGNTAGTTTGYAYGVEGGGLFNAGTATLTDCTVSDNFANTYFGGIGGGVSNRGTLSMVDCTVTGNNADSTGFYNSGRRRRWFV